MPVASRPSPTRCWHPLGGHIARDSTRANLDYGMGNPGLRDRLTPPAGADAHAQPQCVEPLLSSSERQRRSEHVQVRGNMVEKHVASLNAPCQRGKIEPFCRRVRSLVTPSRFAHILRVAVLAEEIAVANGFEPDEVEATALAGILHDAARDMRPEELYRLAPADNEVEREQALAVHGRASRALAESWGVTDERVLDAVAGHVFGVTVGDRIGMAVYVADVSEPGRGVNGDIRDLAMVDLERAYRCAVESKVHYLRSKGLAVHPATLKVYEQIDHAT